MQKYTESELRGMAHGETKGWTVVHQKVDHSGFGGDYGDTSTDEWLTVVRQDATGLCFGIKWSYSRITDRFGPLNLREEYRFYYQPVEMEPFETVVVKWRDKTDAI